MALGYGPPTGLTNSQVQGGGCHEAVNEDSVPPNYAAQLTASVGPTSAADEQEVSGMTVTRYTLWSHQKIVVGLVFLVVIGVLGLRSMLSRPVDPTDVLRMCFIVAWCSFLVFAVYSAIASPHQLIVHENDELEFVSWTRRLRIYPRDIHSVEATRIGSPRLLLRHSSGKIYLPVSFSGLHQFLTDLQRANPSVRFSRC